MTKIKTDTPAPTFSFWAVAKIPQTSQVALKLNDSPPVLMTLQGAREFSAAIKAELDVIPVKSRRAS